MSVGRCRFGTLADKWHKYIFVSEQEMRAMVKGTGWKISRVFRQPDPNKAIQYIAELVKE
ncbi:MAG: hypothetical protein Q8O90_07720 [Elusimicrobiota bacterium]|nr:hypothetical protein [Elusimicrobiota bacterium]